MMTSDAALLVCTSQSWAVWQWRHSTSFSRRKNDSTPASSVASAATGRQRPERLGQQRQECDAEQRAHGIADQPGHQPYAEAVAEKEEREAVARPPTLPRTLRPTAAAYSLHAE